MALGAGEAGHTAHEACAGFAGRGQFSNACARFGRAVRVSARFRKCLAVCVSGARGRALHNTRPGKPELARLRISSVAASLGFHQRRGSHAHHPRPPSTWGVRVRRPTLRYTCWCRGEQRGVVEDGDGFYA